MGLEHKQSEISFFKETLAEGILHYSATSSNSLRLNLPQSPHVTKGRTRRQQNNRLLNVFVNLSLSNYIPCTKIGHH